MQEDVEKKSNKGWIVAIIVLILVVAVALILFFVVNNNNIRNKTFTAENYEELMDQIGEDLEGSDDLYYLSYSMLYYIMRDGMAAALTGNEDESAIMVNIYGKKVQELIDEGKQLMEDNGVSLVDYKEQINNSDSLFSESY